MNEITLPGGITAVRKRLKCDIRGCRHTKTGYLTTHRSNLGGGAFYDRNGKLLADLREVHFVCNEHGFSNAKDAVQFLYREEE